MSDIGTQATMEKKNAGTNTDLYKQIINLNLEQKKKPHNIQINNKAKQQVVQPNVKHSAKQSYRRYKSKTEPKLHSKIMINEDDDIINKIKEAFGLQAEKPNKNYLEVQTGSAGSIIDNISQQPTLAPASTSSFGTPDINKLTPEKIDKMRFDDVMKVLKRFHDQGNKEDQDIIDQLYFEKKKESKWDGMPVDEEKQLVRDAAKRMIDRRQIEAQKKTAGQRKIEAKLQEINDISPADQAELTGRVNLREATGLLLGERPEISLAPKIPETSDEDYHYDDQTIDEEEEKEEETVPVTKARPSMLDDRTAARTIQRFFQSSAMRDRTLLKHSISDIQSQASTLAPDRSLFDILNMTRRGRPKTAENKRKEFAAALLQQKKINKDKSPYQRPERFSLNNPYNDKFSYAKQEIYNKNPDKLYELNLENIYSR
jgi:hypothetical protein